MILDSLDDAVIARGVNGLITAWSSGAERLYGYSACEAVGQAYDMIVPSPLRGWEREMAGGSLKAGLCDSYRASRLCRDGVLRGVWVRAAPITGPDGAILGVSTVECERHAGDSEADRDPGESAAQDRGATWTPDVEGYLRSAFDDAPIGIALLSIHPASDGRILRVNRAFCLLTGYAPEELEQANVHTLLHPEDADAELEAMTRLTEGEITHFQLEQRLLHAERHAIWTLVNASLVHDATGRPLYCIWQLQDIEERKRYEGELGFLVEHDPLTGLLNRRGLIRELSQQIADARRYSGHGAVLFFDLDNFKHINDMLGHSVGDEIIADVARLVDQRLRETDIFARLGGDEFAVVLPHATVGEAGKVGASLLAAVKDGSSVTFGERGRVSMSIGITGFNEPGKDTTAEDVLIDADAAMYAAKEAGKDRIVDATAATRMRTRSRLTWAERVRRSVNDGLFELHCQPIVDLVSDSVCQWELLLRMPGENGELILPSQFLYTAERSGLILEVDRWVLGEAIRLIVEQQSTGNDLRLGVNISGRSVGDAGLLGLIERRLQETSIDPMSLVLEVTETAAIANMDRARSFATKLRALGCCFALDDFGSGFGSFYYLKHIPFDYVKIDGEFIRNLPASSVDQLILASIVQMSKGLGKRTVAEFVGDGETVDVLRKHGVDYAQGYFLGGPRPVSEGWALTQ